MVPRPLLPEPIKARTILSFAPITEEANGTFDAASEIPAEPIKADPMKLRLFIL
jgi:hypothetical protein